jgi:hypothetical protein
MANVAVGFQLTANAAGMAQGINAGVVELQKLGLAAKQTAGDVRILTGLQLGTAFVSAVRAVASSFTSFTAGASASIDATNKLSRSLGISFGELQRLQLAADLSGASSETLANAFTRAQVTITKASKGGREATASLRALGLSVGELSSLSASQQFEAIATAITNIENPAERAAAAVSIFGRSGAQLLPTFQELAGNLQDADNFFSAFRSQLTGDDAKRVESINDAFTRTQAAVTQTAALVLSKLEPALTAGARAVQGFLQGLDISAVAASAESAIGGLARAAEAVGSAFSIAYNVLAPLATAVLPVVASTLGFISGNLQGAAIGAGAAALALGAYTIATTGAAAATAALSGAITALLSRTGVGLLLVVFGSLAGAAASYAFSGTDASKQVAEAVAKSTAVVEENKKAFERAGTAAQNFGAKVQASVKIPNLSIGDIAQDSINQAQSAIAGLAKELGGTVNLPQELVSQFAEIQNLAQRANGDLVNQRVLLTQLVQESSRFADAVRQVTERRQADTRAAQEAAEATRKAAEDARKRTQDLAFEGIGGGEQSRIKLAQDLVAIDRERAAAEQALQAARKAGDADALAAARDRLRLVGDAAKTAREQDRQRQLQALGIDNNLLKPAQTIATQFESLREAIRQGLLQPDQINAAVQNIAKEGLDARKEIARELSRPSQQALRVSDIRSSEGISQFFATGRQDPAIEQRREQLARLIEIRRELQNLRAMNVEIKG